MAISDERIDAYLRAYGDSLADFDAERSAALWEVPGTMVGDAGVAVVHDRQAMVAGLEQGYPLYRSLGLATVDAADIETNRLTDRLARVRVRWVFRDADGGVLTDSTYVYVLRADDEGTLHACVAISIDAEEKLAALAAAKGVEL